MLAQATPRRRVSPLTISELGARIRSATTTVVAIGVVGVAILLAAWINSRAIEATRQMALSIEIRERAERFLGHVRDAETGQRGYLLTGNTAYLAPFTSGRAAALPELDALAKLVETDAAQTQRVATAREQTNRKLAELDTTVTLAREGKQAESIARLREGSGVGAMDELRGTVQQIQLGENIRLIALGKREERRRLLASAGIIVALAALAFAAWLQLRTRQRRTSMLAMTNAELEQIVSERTQQLEGERMRIEALLRDVNHRVGNNLAMVSALLNVQSRQTREPAVKAALAQAQSRIQAIAAGQRRLRLDIETDEIDARAYMEDLLAEIGKAAEGRPIRIELDMDSIRLQGRDAVSFVVIVNELVTNAIKHAFPNNISGRITIRLRQSDDGEVPSLVLEVEDDGIGTPTDSEVKGLGQTVIASLLRSMRATMTSEALAPGSPRPGTRVALVFPKRQ